MLKSFWKKYWLDMLIGIVSLIMAIVMMFVSPESPVASTTWALASFIWISGAHIGYNRDRINALTDRVIFLERKLYKEEEQENSFGLEVEL
jgi:hypothetical protein